MSETLHPVRAGQGCGTTDDDLRTARRFVLGRPGWRVEALATALGDPCLGLATPCPDTGGRRRWRVVRIRGEVVVRDEASGRDVLAVPTVREALVEVWEAVTVAAPD
jgi:hypothetical protein